MLEERKKLEAGLRKEIENRECKIKELKWDNNRQNDFAQKLMNQIAASKQDFKDAQVLAELKAWLGNMDLFLDSDGTGYIKHDDVTNKIKELQGEN